MYTGDILFQEVTPENADAFNGNAVDYLGGEYDLQTDPIASPFFAEPSDFAGSVPPLYFAVGASESILGDSVRVAQHAAQGGTDVILEASTSHCLVFGGHMVTQSRRTFMYINLICEFVATLQCSKTSKSSTVVLSKISKSSTPMLPSVLQVYHGMWHVHLGASQFL